MYVRGGIYLDTKDGIAFKSNNKVNIPDNVIDANIECNNKYNAELMLFTPTNPASPVLKGKE